MNASPPIAVAVVSRNFKELLAECLRTLEPEFESGLVEAWVVDNASTDGAAEMVAERFPWVSLVASDENLGYARAINLVAGRTRSPWIGLANNDLELRPGAVRALYETGERHPEAGAVAPRLILPGGSTQHSVHPFPTLTTAMLVNLSAAGVSPRLAERLCLEGAWDPDRPREVPWALGAFLLVRRAAFDEIGGLDEKQWMHGEDLDLGWRLSRAGWRTRYEPAAAIGHVGSASTKEAFGKDLRPRWTAATYAWMVRRRGRLVTWAVALVNVCGAAVRAALFGVLAAARPERWRRSRDESRYWLSLHRAGLRGRGALLRSL